jgi:hypothetical protein
MHQPDFIRVVIGLVFFWICTIVCWELLAFIGRVIIGPPPKKSEYYDEVK